MAQIDLRMTRLEDTYDGDLQIYGMRVEVTNAIDISDKIFVVQTGVRQAIRINPNTVPSNIFVKVANPLDMEEIPEDQPDLPEEMPYFRVNTIDLNFYDLTSLNETWDFIQEDVAGMVAAINQGISDPVTETVVFGALPETPAPAEFNTTDYQIPVGAGLPEPTLTFDDEGVSPEKDAGSTWPAGVDRLDFELDEPFTITGYLLISDDSESFTFQRLGDPFIAGGGGKGGPTGESGWRIRAASDSPTTYNVEFSLNRDWTFGQSTTGRRTVVTSDSIPLGNKVFVACRWYGDDPRGLDVLINNQDQSTLAQNFVGADDTFGDIILTEAPTEMTIGGSNGSIRTRDWSVFRRYLTLQELDPFLEQDGNDLCPVEPPPLQADHRWRFNPNFGDDTTTFVKDIYSTIDATASGVLQINNDNWCLD